MDADVVTGCSVAVNCVAGRGRELDADVVTGCSVARESIAVAGGNEVDTGVGVTVGGVA